MLNKKTGERESPIAGFVFLPADKRRMIYSP
jgi:hypothetical protein